VRDPVASVPARPGEATIRAAIPEDWPRVSSLLSESRLPLDGALDHFAGFVVAERGGRLVGCAAIERHGEVGLLRSVAVVASERGDGLGAALVERCIEHAAREGLAQLVLLTTTAADYFPRFGFAVADRGAVPDAVRASEEFRGACPASAIVMQLTLTALDDTGCRALAPGVRPARVQDAAAIAEIYNAGIDARIATFETRERTPADIEAWFANDRYPILVADAEGRVVGWVAASAYRARACYAGIAEFSIYVHPAARGQRIGDVLMRQFLPGLERAGFWKVLSRIFPENAASRALCRRHGFREVGVYERHARLDGSWRDVIIVERLLSESARAGRSAAPWRTSSGTGRTRPSGSSSTSRASARSTRRWPPALPPDSRIRRAPRCPARPGRTAAATHTRIVTICTTPRRSTRSTGRWRPVGIARRTIGRPEPSRAVRRDSTSLGWANRSRPQATPPGSRSRRGCSTTNCSRSSVH
jgi:phosphinothricin acetyltransferase